jgi:1-acyl-sn-glycerol-3-phosphate acyltransferase
MYETLTVVIILLLLLGVLLKRALQACAKANQAEWGETWLNYIDGLNRLFCKYYHRLEYTPIDLPKEGPAVIVANHLSGLDPFLLFVATRRPISFLIAREQYERFGLRWLFQATGCIPVDRTGRPELALRAAFRALEAGKVIALFPQGKIVSPGEPHKPLKRGGLWLAQHTHCPIYPVHISGIRGVGHIFRGIVWRSEARLESFPPLLWTEESSLEELQKLIEGN